MLRILILNIFKKSLFKLQPVEEFSVAVLSEFVTRKYTNTILKLSQR